MEVECKNHKIDGIGLLEQRIYDPVILCGSSSSSSRSSRCMPLCVGKHKDYSIIAYPGPEVVMAGRAEHLPLHVHIKCKQNKKELRVRIDNLQELDGQSIPRDLRAFLEQEDTRSYLTKNAESVYRTGRISE